MILSFSEGFTIKHVKISPASSGIASPRISVDETTVSFWNIYWKSWEKSLCFIAKFHSYVESPEDPWVPTGFISSQCLRPKVSLPAGAQRTRPIRHLAVELHGFQWVFPGGNQWTDGPWWDCPGLSVFYVSLLVMGRCSGSMHLNAMYASESIWYLGDLLNGRSREDHSRSKSLPPMKMRVFLVGYKRSMGCDMIISRQFYTHLLDLIGTFYIYIYVCVCVGYQLYLYIDIMIVIIAIVNVTMIIDWSCQYLTTRRGQRHFGPLALPHGSPRAARIFFLPKMGFAGGKSWLPSGNSWNLWKIYGKHGLCPRVSIQKTIENGHCNSWFTHREKRVIFHSYSDEPGDRIWEIN